MKRRTLLKGLVMTPLFGIVEKGVAKNTSFTTDNVLISDSIGSDRDYWVAILNRMASPILENISKGEFRKNMPMEVSSTFDSRDPVVGYLEAFGRLLAGMAPWLALPADDSQEGKLRTKLKDQALSGIAHGVDPNSPDYFLWDTNTTKQPLVDAAFLAQALLRAPKALWEPLPNRTKQQLINCFKGLRSVKAHENNWLLFAAMTETFLYSIGEDVVRDRIDQAVDKFDTDWYVGDGWYSDGPKFSFDHYNGFVIHCMQVETLRHNLSASAHYQAMYDRAYKRMQRYSHHLERMISPEGYPLVVGRSSTYRNAAFQPLAAVILDNKLPEDISKGQARAALTAVLKNTFVDATFKKNGWLTMGVVGENQTNLADYYTTSGSMYMASLSFLPLGLAADDELWITKNESWTSQKIWKGEPFPKDYHVNY